MFALVGRRPRVPHHEHRRRSHAVRSEHARKERDRVDARILGDPRRALSGARCVGPPPIEERAADEGGFSRRRGELVDRVAFFLRARRARPGGMVQARARVERAVARPPRRIDVLSFLDRGSTHLFRGISSKKSVGWRALDRPNPGYQITTALRTRTPRPQQNRPSVLQAASTTFLQICSLFAAGSALTRESQQGRHF